MNSKNKRVVFITAPDEKQALAIAEKLVEEKLAACVNVIPGARSIYVWEGAIRRDTEVLLIAKTSANKFNALASCVSAIHPYQTPEIISLPIMQGAADYMNWLDESLEASSNMK